MKRPKLKRRSSSQKRLFWGILALLVVFCLVLLGKSLSLLHNFTASEKGYSWDGSSTINLVVKAYDTSLISYNPQEKRVDLVVIPEETYLKLPFEFGRYPLRSVYELGEMESPPQGKRLLTETIRQTLGVGVDGVIITQASWQKAGSEEILKQLSKNPFQIISFLGSIQTNLSSWEVFELLWGINGARNDQINAVYLDRSNISDSILLSDGSRALQLNQIKLDLLVQKNINDNRLFDEALNIAIQNGTPHPKLAEEAARIVTNMGGRVISTSNSKQAVERSLVLGKGSYTKTRLSQLFAPNCLQARSDCDRSKVVLEEFRADVVIILGEDYYKLRNKR